MKTYKDLFKTNKIIVNKQNNSINGYFIRNKRKYFYKIINELSFFNEINGYFNCNNQIPVMKILEAGKFNDKYYIIYEYNKDILKDNGTLNDLFVKYDNKNAINKKLYKNIIDIYNNNLKNKKKQPNSKNDIYFKDRISSRLLGWYDNFKLFDRKVIIDDEIFYLRKIIKDTKNFFSKEYNLDCFFTQGDPNTLNIGLTPCFFDLETCGYNSIVGELAITIISVLFYDNYFCPKYHKSSYFNHEKILEKYEHFKPYINYKIDDRIEINCDVKTSKIRIEYIKDYLMMLKNNNVSIDKTIIYYLVMRLLCVFDIKNMDEIDQIYSIYLVCDFYKLITNSNDIINDLYNFISGIDGGQTWK